MSKCFHATSLSVITIYVLACALQGVISLKCYKCINLECPEGERGEKNEQLCQSARSFIVKSLSVYYELGPVGYIGNCPARDETLQWTLLQQNREECPWIKESATCSLGRIQVITGEAPTKVISHATILGCMKPALLRYMKDSTSNPHVCSIYKQNNTREAVTYLHELMLENCPKVTDYCNSKDFCIPYSESGVRVFVTGGNDRSFEAGIIIAIVAIILIIIVIVLLANFCKSPLNRGANYSPAEAQRVPVVREDYPDTPNSESPPSTSSRSATIV